VYFFNADYKCLQIEMNSTCQSGAIITMYITSMASPNYSKKYLTVVKFRTHFQKWLLRVTGTINVR